MVSRRLHLVQIPCGLSDIMWPETGAEPCLFAWSCCVHSLLQHDRACTSPMRMWTVAVNVTMILVEGSTTVTFDMQHMPGVSPPCGQMSGGPIDASLPSSLTVCVSSACSCPCLTAPWRTAHMTSFQLALLSSPKLNGPMQRRCHTSNACYVLLALYFLGFRRAAEPGSKPPSSMSLCKSHQASSSVCQHASLTMLCSRLMYPRMHPAGCATCSEA